MENKHSIKKWSPYSGDAHAPEIDAIIGKIPNKITRYGLYVILIIITIIIILSSSIEYPTIISTNVIIKKLEISDSNVILFLQYPVEDNINNNMIGNKINTIRTGQKSRIKLEKYPYRKFGYLEGTIVKISNPTLNDTFGCSIRLDNTLITSKGYKVVDIRNGKALADIIVSKQTILDKIIASVNIKINN